MELNHHLRAHVRAFAVGRIFVLRNSSRRSAVELLPVLPGRYCRPQFMYVRNRELTGIQLLGILFRFLLPSHDSHNSTGVNFRMPYGIFL